MVAYKAAQFQSFLSSPDPTITAALFYGPDQALVSDNAASLSRRIARQSDPAGDIIRLAENALAENPGLLTLEAQTMSMFSGRQVIRATAVQRFPVDILQNLLNEPIEAFVIIEAGNLRPGSRLRKIFETASTAAAFPCYELSPRDMSSFIDRQLVALSATIDRQASDQLASLFGGDQARARAELVKLALYAGKGHTITTDDIDAIIGDVGQAALDIFSRLTGNRDRRGALRQLDSLIASGLSPQGAIAALGRYFERLHRLCAAIESGESPRTALGRFKPPLHFRQRDALEAQARSWSRRDVARVIERTEKAIELARLKPELERQLTERLVISIGR